MTFFGGQFPAAEVAGEFCATPAEEFVAGCVAEVEPVFVVDFVAADAPAAGAGLQLTGTTFLLCAALCAALGAGLEAFASEAGFAGGVCDEAGLDGEGAGCGVWDCPEAFAAGWFC